MLLTATGSRVDARIGGETPLVPAHFDAEVLSALRRMVLRRALDVRRAQAGLGLVARLRLERVAIAPLLSEAFELRDRCSAFDALYLALARRRNAVLLTSDERLLRAAKGIAPIELVSL